MLPMDFAGRLRPRDQLRRAMELLEIVEIADHARKVPAALSGGQQQRLAIARALANDPAILVADEPTGSLDSGTAETVLAVFEGLVGRGKTVVLVTHDKDVAAHGSRVLDPCPMADPVGPRRRDCSCLAPGGRRSSTTSSAARPGPSSSYSRWQSVCSPWGSFSVPEPFCLRGWHGALRRSIRRAAPFVRQELFDEEFVRSVRNMPGVAEADARRNISARRRLTPIDGRT